MTLMHTSPDAVPAAAEPTDPMGTAQATTATPVPVAGGVRATDAWTAQRALRAEKAQLTRWRRLLRARLDLTVAGFAPPEPLGLTTWGAVPDSSLATRELPEAGVLQSAVAGMTTADPVELMTHLRELDRLLGRYDRWVDGALEDSLQDSLTRLADDAGR